ncbi:hypothetical protein GWA24_00900 [Pediococcus acidilactici]|nr:hypothetical protein GWA24_00900 [Pediococcus acidilactici]
MAKLLAMFYKKICLRGPNLIGSRIFGVGKYFHSKSTRPFLITKKGI